MYLLVGMASPRTPLFLPPQYNLCARQPYSHRGARRSSPPQTRRKLRMCEDRVPHLDWREKPQSSPPPGQRPRTIPLMMNISSYVRRSPPSRRAQRVYQARSRNNTVLTLRLLFASALRTLALALETVRCARLRTRVPNHRPTTFIVPTLRVTVQVRLSRPSNRRHTRDRSLVRGWNSSFAVQR